MKSNTILIIAVALIVGFVMGFVMRPVLSPPAAPAPVAAAEPGSGNADARSPQYFAAHVGEARQIVAGCRAGTVRGDECIYAGQAIEEVEGKERMKTFLGH